MTAPTTTAEDARACIEAIRPRPFTCAACGVRFTGRNTDTETITRTLLNGSEGTYGLCGDCTAKPSESATIASLLDLDPTDTTLDGLTISWYADLVHASPSRPNSTPWQHVDLTALAEQIRDRRADLTKRRGGPCCFCGISITNEGGQWWTTGVESDRRYYCERCWWTVDPTNVKKESWRLNFNTAAFLCAIPGSCLSDLPRDFATKVGFRPARPGESGETPWEHLDIREMRRRAHEFLSSVNWRHIDKYDPKMKGVVTW